MTPTFAPRTEPIFHLTRPFAVAGYEWFAGPVGVPSAEEFFATHSQSDVMDAHLLARCHTDTEELRQGGFVTVNVEPRSLQSDAFWATALAHADGMVLEISERGPLPYTEALEYRLAEWRERGGMVAFDDYGVGSSRVMELGWVVPEMVKLDRDFTRLIIERPNRLLCSVVGLLVAESRYVVAEGVETPEEAETLEALGITLGQGRHFEANVAELAS